MQLDAGKKRRHLSSQRRDYRHVETLHRMRQPSRIGLKLL
jgi:hypothetical protein